MASSDVIKPADLEQLLKDLKDVVEKTRIYQTEMLPEDRQDRQEYDDLQKKIECSLSSIRNKDSNFRIVLVGRRGFGKSSLLNAMVGQSIAPCLSHHKAGYILRVAGDNVDQIQIGPQKNQLQDGSGASDYLLNVTPSQDPVVDMVVPIESAPVLDHQTLLIDCPGLGDGDKLLEDKVLEQCLMADLLLLVLSAQESISKTEADFLVSIYAQRELPVTCIIMNKSDQLQDLEDINKIIRPQIKQYVSTLGPLRNVSIEENLFFMSTRYIRKDNGSDVHREHLVNQFETFMEYLKLCVTSKREAARYHPYFKFIKETTKRIRYKLNHIQEGSVSWLEDSQETSKSLLSSYENNPKILPKQLLVDNITTERVQCIRKQNEARLEMFIEDTPSEYKALQEEKDRVTKKKAEERVQILIKRCCDGVRQELKENIKLAEEQLADKAEQIHGVSFDVSSDEDCPTDTVIQKATELFDNHYLVDSKRNRTSSQLSISKSASYEAKRPEKSGCCWKCLMCFACVCSCIADCIASCWRCCVSICCCQSDDRNTFRTILVNYLCSIEKSEENISAMKSKLHKAMDHYHNILEEDLKRCIRSKLQETLEKIKIILREKYQSDIKESKAKLDKSNENPTFLLLISAIEKKTAKLLFHYSM